MSDEPSFGVQIYIPSASQTRVVALIGEPPQLSGHSPWRRYCGDRICDLSDRPAPNSPIGWGVGVARGRPERREMARWWCETWSTVVPTKAGALHTNSSFASATRSRYRPSSSATFRLLHSWCTWIGEFESARWPQVQGQRKSRTNRARPIGLLPHCRPSCAWAISSSAWGELKHDRIM
jgi:hypothetical protein